MIKEIEKSSFIQSLPSFLTSEISLLFESLWDAPKAVIALTIQEILKKHILIITGGERENRLIEDLMYFSEKEILTFPAWETLPGEEIAPSPDIIGKRYEILYHLAICNSPHIVLTPIQGLLQKICTPEVTKEKLLSWRKKDNISFEKVPQLLTSLGYHRETVAADKREFAIRGGIIDIFPVSAAEPYRIDFFGDEIDQIRTYDPISQRSVAKKDSVLIPPAFELELLKKQDKLCTLLEHLGGETVILFDDLLAIEDRYVSIKKLPGALSPLFLSFAELLQKIEGMQKIFFTKEPVEMLSKVIIKEKAGRSFYTGKRPLQKIGFDIFDHHLEASRLSHPFLSIDDFFSKEGIGRIDAILSSAEKMQIAFLTASESEENALKKGIRHTNLPLPPSAQFMHGYLSSGFVLQDANFALIPYTELTKQYKVHREKWRTTYHTPASEFHHLEKGDLVVHFHNGIGKFLGIEKQKNHLGHEEEFLMIEYANASKLYVPLSQSYLISRYIGTKEESPPLHTLGTKKWQRVKANTQKAIIGYARDLLHVQAQREAKGGFHFPQDSHEMLLFEQEFPFIETEDQIRAIQDLKEDMCSTKAMDRLICGDVGYGKTEVAMRAAFKAVVDGQKQVAVLVPTTVLAMQHFDTFSERMRNFPVTIGVASRFIKPKKLKETLDGIASGTVDILIGTHRIIGKDVAFKNLGLLIIDEEQRFGVRAKEHLKKAKAGVDCLTLSATPIPRTLYFSLVGARDMSIINTPPQDRLPIKTVIAEREPSLIKNALLRELTRDGQAYIIHNRVESIYGIAKEIETLLPSAKIAVVHGQMPPDEIDSTFHNFKLGEIDILVATTIVENGIDIPNANTLIIDRADRYGMADLYQLRGRVGRWNRPAYAYFLIPKFQALPEIPRKRLQALVETSGFGGGMKLALRDLEIRGAGDILGVQQSGNVSAIGFHFYCKLLKRTIDTLKKDIPPTFFETRIEIPFIDASLPPSYIEETSLRMEIYHRLGDITSLEEVDDLFRELEDRFGPIPPVAKWLYHISRLRIFASERHFTLLKFSKNTLTIERQLKEKRIEKTLPFPRFDDPEEFERAAVQLTQENSILE